MRNLRNRGPDLQGAMHNVCDLEQWATCTCDAGQHVLGGLRAQGLGGRAETWERVDCVATEMGNRRQRGQVVAHLWVVVVGARGVVGGTCQYTGGGIRNSLIGKAVVALNDMFGYSSQLRNNFKGERKRGLFVFAQSSNTARDHT